MEMATIPRPQNEGPSSGALVRAGLQPAGHQELCPAHQERQHGTSIIAAFLLDQVPEFRRLVELRRRGWENPAGDRYFEIQRREADKTDRDTSRIHFRLMQRVAQEIHATTLGFATRIWPGSILDMCVAPGGFLATAMKLNPGSDAVGFSLPPSEGGYNILLSENDRICVKLVDITMLAADMGVTNIPEDHPDARKFLPRQIRETQLFDLVLCDGHVLRTHIRASYRETREHTRLKTTQLALGLEHIRPGGTMTVLFHKAESWDTVCFIRRFSKFSSVQLFKPTVCHATRSSFYMVATNVQSQHPEAVLAIEKWKAVWRAATFGTDEEYTETLRSGEDSPEEVLKEFGSELVKQGRKVWNVQAEALSRASFVKEI